MGCLRRTRSYLPKKINTDASLGGYLRFHYDPLNVASLLLKGRSLGPHRSRVALCGPPGVGRLRSLPHVNGDKVTRGLRSPVSAKVCWAPSNGGSQMRFRKVCDPVSVDFHSGRRDLIRDTREPRENYARFRDCRVRIWDTAGLLCSREKIEVSRLTGTCCKSHPLHANISSWNESHHERYFPN